MRVVEVIACAGFAAGCQVIQLERRMDVFDERLSEIEQTQTVCTCPEEKVIDSTIAPVEPIYPKRSHPRIVPQPKVKGQRK